MLDPLDQPVPMVAVDDIGVAAADLLMTPSARGRVVELSHPKAYSASDVAAAIAEISGRPVTATAIPKAERSRVYAEWGLTPSAARNMSDMIDGFNSGWIRFQGSPAEHVGAPTPLAEALKRAAGEMKPSPRDSKRRAASLMILITRATGGSGLATVREFDRHNVPVRALYRTPVVVRSNDYALLEWSDPAKTSP